ncbi:uncharacterized protein LOC128836125, partial [Malaclemys terrapin pileata]|uniref:uncharacterized protein LOC128836125 n=1 Tax=Malaclemys terrapin pileata TaxID=2991368 RepID=UPI0023A8C9FD
RHHLFPLCYQELSRKVNMSATASPSVLCGHLLTEGNRCRLSKDQSCLRFPASPSAPRKWVSPPPPPKHLPNTHFFSFSFWCSTREICSVMGLHNLGWKQVAIVGATPLSLTTFVCAGELRLAGGGGQETRGNVTMKPGSTLSQNHQGVSKSKASNQDNIGEFHCGIFSNSFFLLVPTLSFFFFFNCVCFLYSYHFAFRPAGGGGNPLVGVGGMNKHKNKQTFKLREKATYGSKRGGKGFCLAENSLSCHQLPLPLLLLLLLHLPPHSSTPAYHTAVLGPSSTIWILQHTLHLDAIVVSLVLHQYQYYYLFVGFYLFIYLIYWVFQQTEEEEKRVILVFFHECACAYHWHFVHLSETRSQCYGQVNHEATVNFKNYCKIFL